MAHCNDTLCMRTTDYVGKERVCRCNCDTCRDSAEIAAQQPDDDSYERRSYRDAPTWTPRKAAFWIVVAILVLYALVPGLHARVNGWFGGSGAPTSVFCSGPTTGGFVCQVTANVAGTFCWDAVAVCGGVKHVAHACSAKLAVGSVETVRVQAIPPIGPEMSCESVRVEGLEAQ